MKRILTILLATLVGCGPSLSTRQIMESWRGSHVSSLIRSWGPPQHVVPDEKDGKIYIWSNKINIRLADGKTETKANIDHGRYWLTVNSSTTYTPPLEVKGDKVRMFWANSEGIIYHWRAKGFLNDPEEGAAILAALAIGAVIGLILVALGDGSGYYD